MPVNWRCPKPNLLSMRHLQLGLLCGALLCSCQETSRAAPETQAQKQKQAPEKVEAVATKIVILNDTQKTLTFEQTFGSEQPLGISSLDGGQEMNGSLVRCWCECGDASCPDAARPETRLLKLEAGKSHTINWKGSVKHYTSHPKTGNCCKTFGPGKGRYILTACTQDNRCGRVEVSLPTTKPITIPMSAVAQASDCDSLNLAVARREAATFARNLKNMLPKRNTAACSDKLSCVASDDLKARSEAQRGQACSLFVIPRGSEVELRAFLPLPQGYVGGENYSSFSDPDFTRVFRVRYEQ